MFTKNKSADGWSESLKSVMQVSFGLIPTDSLESWCKGSSAPSIKSLVVDEERMNEARPPGEVSALSKSGQEQHKLK